MQVIRSESHHNQQVKSLDERLQRATDELLALTPPAGRGHKQLRVEEELQTAIQEILERQRVIGLLEVTWRRDELQTS